VVDGSDRHEHHDPLLIAALLDVDTSPSERAAAEMLIQSCTDCAALHADLVALSSATHALPAVPRPRDFRLTAADAARLDATTVGEPSAPTPRLTREMTATNTASAHATHDTMLVASLADHSLAASERAAAETLIGTCGLCAALHLDLVALTAATRAMPTPPRPRSYTLTPDDAIRLRPAGWRRWVAAFGTSRDALSRPLAVGLTSLGLAGLLVATVPSALFQGGATAGAPARPGAAAAASQPARDVTVAAPEAVSGAPVVGAAAPSGAYVDNAASPAAVPVATDPNALAGGQPDRASLAPVQGVIGGGSSKGSDAGSGKTNDVAPGGELALLSSTSSIPTLVLVSSALLIVGLGLFLIRWAARRFGDG
jgi:anti-sigma factor RsiW